ncbi:MULTISPECIES: Rrf2 family transcriptional regulator [unclassified Flavobacterium]|jgi:Rrf2 family iron-sulfur cluster assembly transcriptional regulator|uniref:RrF2 family transcriptional regulator n=1 Tax=unclassified Flavobacterium TaxID=196869 RepID=UPI000F0C9EFB|nr:MULTISPECIES: Rrf2 family transcriptional regulator [unclassified Flavobacterium]AYN03179.1 Rrf2 family transcriptional regulator [Flavobacterium sp. 140616W15]MCD0474917.1 Rrf2 family transcriptional regulator [Flavobacterium sp. EDS]
MFSKACEYAIRASIFIATKSSQGIRVGIKDVAKEIDSPEPFTAKIMQILTKNGIIDSAKGVGGGFEVSNVAIKSIKLIQIVDAVDGDSIYMGCGIGLKECSESHPCPVHNEFKVIRGLLLDMLTNTTLEELALGVKSGEFFLKR